MTQSEFVAQLKRDLYMEAREVQEAFIGFMLARRNAVDSCRQIATPWKELVPIVKKLIADNYHRRPDQWRAAAEWIDRCNWQYKSPKSLVYTDFYPTPEMVKDSPIKWVTVEEATKRYREAYERGKRDAMCQTMPVATATPVSAEERKKEWEALAASFAARDEYQRKIDDLERQLERVTRERDSLKLQMVAGPLFSDVTT